MVTKRYVAKTFLGLEGELKQELLEAGVTKIRGLTRAVEFDATKEQLYNVNYTLRTAISVLYPIYSFEAENDRVFYQKIKEFNWFSFLKTNQSFLITNSVKSEVFTHSHYISLKMKDAIVDKFMEERGKRPNIDTDSPDIKIHLKISGTKCSISLDTSGDSLFKRGYREQTNEAPLNECLAAGLILKTGWKGDSSLLDIMCGSGTIPIEAAMISSNTPSGFFRKKFGFMSFKDFDIKLWDKVKKEADKKINSATHKIFGYDVDEKSIRIAQENMSKLNHLKSIIRFKVEDARYASLPLGCNMVIFNPPYGERLNEHDEVVELYSEIANNVKKQFKNATVALISSNMEAIDKITLPVKSSYRVLNGSLECKFMIYKT